MCVWSPYWSVLYFLKRTLIAFHVLLGKQTDWLFYCNLAFYHSDWRVFLSHMRTLALYHICIYSYYVYMYMYVYSIYVYVCIRNYGGLFPPFFLFLGLNNKMGNYYFLSHSLKFFHEILRRKGRMWDKLAIARKKSELWESQGFF